MRAGWAGTLLNNPACSWVTEPHPHPTPVFRCIKPEINNGIDDHVTRWRWEVGAGSAIHGGGQGHQGLPLKDTRGRIQQRREVTARDTFLFLRHPKGKKGHGQEYHFHLLPTHEAVLTPWRVTGIRGERGIPRNLSFPSRTQGERP